MNIAIITLFPEMFEALTCYGITGRAVSKGLISIKCINPREFTTDRHQTVDDRPYGGGPGMVMRIQPLEDAVEQAKKWLLHKNGGNEEVKNKVIYLSPQGRKLDQSGIIELKSQTDLVLIAGRYEGIDERFIDATVDEEWSIGDYVLSGGELPAMVLIDALTRFIPGVLGDAESAEQDSFVSGLLDCPHYTRPEHYQNRSVPSVLLSGDHKKIERWRLLQSLGRTWERRPDLLENIQLDDVQVSLLDEYKSTSSAGEL